MRGHVVFDLDGTLIDSRPGIEAAARSAQRQVLPGRTPVAVSQHIGPPVRDMFAAACGVDDPDMLDRLVAGFRSAYDGGAFRDSRPYDGVPVMLAELAAAGCVLHVVTNKPERPTRAILGHLGWLGLFGEVLSPDSLGGPARGKDELLRVLLMRTAVPAASAMYVGDDERDGLACRAVGMSFAFAAWGYGRPPAGLPAADGLRAPEDITRLVRSRLQGIQSC